MGRRCEKDFIYNHGILPGRGDYLQFYHIALGFLLWPIRAMAYQLFRESGRMGESIR